MELTKLVIPVGIAMASEAVVVASTLAIPVRPVAEADAMAAEVAASASVTGQTVVAMTMVSVTIMVLAAETVVRGEAARTVKVVEPVWVGSALEEKATGSAEEMAVIEGDAAAMSPTPVAPVA